MYVITVELDVLPDFKENYRTVIEQQAKTSVEREDGCLKFEVSISEDDPNRFLLYEVYKDKKAFKTHIEQPHSKENGAKTKPWIKSQSVRTWLQPAA